MATKCDNNADSSHLFISIPFDYKVIPASAIAALGPTIAWLIRHADAGAAGKLERARFKVSYKREQLAQFESLYLVNRK